MSKTNFFTIMLDDISHTVIYLVKACSKEEALAKFTISETAAVKLENGEWIIRDLNNSVYDEHYSTLEDLVDRHWRITSERFEIMETQIDLSKDVQDIFCSKEKTIK